MTDRQPPSDAAAHKVADALLPWFANGTLEGDELALVERHLRECAECRREVDWLRELRAACTAAGNDPALRGARRLRDHLDAPARAAPAQRSRPEWRWALAGAFAAFVALGFAFLGNDMSPALYRTLGARDASAPANGAVVVVFEPSTSEFELRRIVRAAGARIVDGPTQTNAYVLDVPGPKREQALQALRIERAVVLAERLDASGARR